MAGFEGVLYIALLVLFAKLFEEVAVRLRQPPIVGYIIAGVLLGPALLGWVQPAGEITLFIQIGVFFLFFLIGLEEIDIPGIFSVLRKRLFAGAALGFAVPFALAVATLYYFIPDMGLTPILAVSSVIGISSLGVVAKILVDLGKLKEPLGLEIFTLIAVLEFIGIIVASVFIQLANPASFQETLASLVPGLPAVVGGGSGSGGGDGGLGGNNSQSTTASLLVGNATLPSAPVTATPGLQGESAPAFNALSFVWLFIRMIIFFSAVTLFGLKVLPRIMRFVRSHLKVREIYFGMFIGMILLVSYFAEASGIHGAIGALLLGVLFSQMPRQDYEDSVRSLHSMAHGVFIPIFFAGIGIYFSFGFLDLPYLLVGALLAVITAGKFAGALLAAAVAKLRPVLTVGAGVMSKGAVDLAIMLSLLSAGLVRPDLFSLVVFGTIVMMLATSLSLKARIARMTPEQAAKELESATETLSPLYARTVLADLKVRSVLTENPPTVYGEMTIKEFSEKHRDYPQPAYVVVTRNERLYLGIVTPGQLRKISSENWDRAIVNDISIQNVRAVKADELLYEVVEEMALHDLELLAVVSDDDRKVIGGVLREDILKHVYK